MISKIVKLTSLLAVVLFSLTVQAASSAVITRDGETYLVDRNYEEWDITQAVKNGFDPKKFQYGIGRNAFTPLDDQSLSNDQNTIRKGSRIIGVKDKKGGKAFSVDRLKYHEIANSYQDEDPVAVAY